jgi:hypothetical protein
MVEIRDRDSCIGYIGELKILPLQSQNIYSLSLFYINNKHSFKVNSEVLWDVDIHIDNHVRYNIFIVFRIAQSVRDAERA